MKKLFLLSILFIAVSYIQAQTTDRQKIKAEVVSMPVSDQPRIYCQLAELYAKDSTDQAIKFANLAYTLTKKTPQNEYHPYALSHMGSLYFKVGKFDEASDAYQDEVEVREKYFKDSVALILAYFNLGMVYEKLDKERSASGSFEKSLALSVKSGNKQFLLRNYEALFNVNYSRGKYKSAFDFFKEYVKIKDSTFQLAQKDLIVLTQQFSQVKSKVEKQEMLLVDKDNQIEQKDKQINLKDSTLTTVKAQNEELEVMTQVQSEEIKELNYQKAYQDEVIKGQRLQNTFLLFGVLFVIGIGLLVYRQSVVRKRLNNELAERNSALEQANAEIEAQRDQLQDSFKIIEDKNKNITDSIRYAMRIQQAALPGDKNLAAIIPNHYIYYKPRDIVSGDFYWVKQMGDLIMLVAADCTGHGVPGAFVSMLGISLLNEISHTTEKITASEILQNMRSRVKTSLKQTGKANEQKDGMDMVLVIINKTTNQLQYAGANNPLVIARKGELTAFKPTKNPIGIYAVEKPFDEQIFQLIPGDILYMYSDGIVDQFGGPKGEKFKTSRLKELIETASLKSMKEQEEIFTHTFDDWKDGHDQLDDMLFVAVQIN